MKPYIIGIAGESGVGKTTISEIISLYYGTDNVLIISTDDLHKWERGNKNWEQFTHLNPEANNLELGDNHLKYLKNGKPIYRSVYNHITGNFNPPIKIYPKKIIIIEGLHAFFSEVSNKLIDLKIFVDTDEDLRVHWKILRDTEERGYKYNDVLKSIAKRKADSLILKNTQLENSNIIITLYPKNKISKLGSKDEIIDTQIKFDYKNNIHNPITKFIQQFNYDLESFVELSQKYSGITYVQENGGNISVKLNDNYFIIKSSGVSFNKVSSKYGFSIFDFKNNSKLDSYPPPSMEYAFHTALHYKYVVHLHPIYSTFICCTKDCEKILKQIVIEPFKLIKYKTPGISLAKEIEKYSNYNVYFLQNHGIIICHDDKQFIANTVESIESACQKYLLQFADSFETFRPVKSLKNIYTPDMAVYSDDQNKAQILSIKQYYDYLAGIFKVKNLNKSAIKTILSMQEEQYRKTL